MINRQMIERAKSRLGGSQTHRPSHGAVRHLLVAADAPVGLEASAMRLQALAQNEAIDKLSGRGGFSPHMRHAR